MFPAFPNPFWKAIIQRVGSTCGTDGKSPAYLFYQSYPPQKVVVGFYYIGKGIENVVRMGIGGRGKDMSF
jgi:hypothetical protein